MDLKNVLSKIKSGDIRFVDLRFTDLRGVWQHFTVVGHEFDEEAIKAGFGFDGSSVRGFQEIYNSDLILIPDTDTFFMDPFHESTVVCICDVYDPITHEPFAKDPRFTAKKAVEYLKKSKIGDVAYFGPEAEFFVFDRLEYDVSPLTSYIDISSGDIGDEGETSDGYPIRPKAGYFPVPPFDKLQDFRSEMTDILESIGVTIEVHHHEVASAGQIEVDMKFDSLLSMADKLMKYKYVARNLAKKYGYTVSFLPKPIFGDNGTGMHINQSIFKAGKNVFYEKKGYAGLSKEALGYIGGILSNVKAILAITNPTNNSYRRLVPHYEAPTAIAYSMRNRSAAIRIPMYSESEKAKRLEFRCPDPTANPYLAFSALVVSGINGIKEKMDPTKLGFGPFDENIWEKKKVKQTPRNFFETLDALSKDRILAESGVFTQELIDSYHDVKMEELKAAMLYPTPADFYFYGDI